MSNSYPGRPPLGKVLWGAAVGWLDPVTRHDEPADVTMELQRLFFQWKDVRDGSAMEDIFTAVEQGRFPWVSFKLPGSWADVAAGEHDEAIYDMLVELDSFDTPIWLTMHHEPDGGGGSNASDETSGPEGHKAMNRRVRHLMYEVGTQNIALSLVLMGWTWDPASRPGDGENRDPDNWWDGDVYDFIGVDHYVAKESTMLNATWSRILTWAALNGVDIGVGEWGMKGEDAAASVRMNEFYLHALQQAVPRVTSLAYFDVPGDWHQGPWLLEGSRMTEFHYIMQDSAAVDTTAPEPVQTFEDVPPGHVFFADVEWIAERGITLGCNPKEGNTKYCPDRYMTRGEMAAMLHRALGSEQ